MSQIKGVPFGDIRGTEAGSSLVYHLRRGDSHRILAVNRVFIDLMVMKLHRNRLKVKIAALGIN